MKLQMLSMNNSFDKILKWHFIIYQLIKDLALAGIDWYWLALTGISWY